MPVITLVLLALLAASCIEVEGQPLLKGRWELLLANSGISAMHMTLTHYNTVIIFDGKQSGASQIRLNYADCTSLSNDENSTTSKDCWAHSVEYNIYANEVRPLHILTDTFCSSGSFESNGTLIQTGGWQSGSKVTRYYIPCSNGTCDWMESHTPLAASRWYASNQILPDNRIIVVGGRRSFSYEFVPKTPGSSEGAFALPFLEETNTVGVENNLYPFLHLSSDGNLFIFANRDSILFDYKKNEVVKKFPTMPGSGARNYPSTGSSVMLPLNYSNNFQMVEILVCGGAPDGAFNAAKEKSTFMKALETCGRIIITDENPQWQMEPMPGPRAMGDMLILPTGEILIINGAKNGTAGWELARVPALVPFLYIPKGSIGHRFKPLATARIPRMYHSSAIVLPDGRVLVGGSNPNNGYRFSGVPFPTELRLEAYIPYYLHPLYDIPRPVITSISTREIKYGSEFMVGFSLFLLPIHSNLRIHVYCPSFTTHSFSMSQRMLSLAIPCEIMFDLATRGYSVCVTAPPSAVAAPSGYYLLTVVNAGVPSRAEWIRFVN